MAYMKRLCYIILITAAFSISTMAQRNVVRSDFFITLRDGTKLDCSRFVPDTIASGLKWHVIMYVHGYADSKEDVADAARAQAKFGYYTFCYSVRGQGNSTGLSNLISRVEMQDLFEVVDYIKRDTLADSNKIAIFGASQGGILPYMAICNGLKVATVISDIASPEFASSWIENGCIKTTGLFTVSYDSAAVRYTPEVNNIRKWMSSKNLSDWDSLAYYMPRNRDFLNDVKNNKIPILISNSWQDKFFNTLGNIKASALLNSPHLMYWGAIEGHGSDTTAAETGFRSTLISNWIDFYLNGHAHTMLDTGTFIFAASHFPIENNMWSFSRYTSPIWPPAGVAGMNFYFTPSGKLSLTPYSGVKDTLKLFNEIKDSSLTMDDAVNNGFAGEVFKAKFSKHDIVFESEPLRADCLLAGTPKLNLCYSSDAPVCQYNFQIWDVKARDTVEFVTRINYTDRHYKPGALKSINVNGTSYAHLFMAGDRIRIVLTNFDTTPADSFLLNNPYVLPVLRNAHNVIVMSKKYPSSITLPLEAIFADAVPGAIAMGGYSLSQNNPNPFYPVTKITYSIPKAEKVRITLSDILGKESAVLVNGNKKQGTHTLELDGRRLASGTYFYTLKTRDFTDTKKMILIK
jgi:predicted acyl esterase